MNLHQQTFITEYLRHNDAIVAYQLAYECSSSDYEQVLQKAQEVLHHPDVAAAISSITEGIRHRVEQEQQAAQSGVLSIQQKRQILAQIATGQLSVEQSYKGKDCNVCSQYVRPTINHMLRAIHIDNKLAGHYPAQKQQVANYSPSRHTKTDTAHCVPQKQTTPENHNKTQQNPLLKHRKSPIIVKRNNQWLSSASSATTKTQPCSSPV